MRPISCKSTYPRRMYSWQAMHGAQAFCELQNGGRHSRRLPSGWTPARTLLGAFILLALTFYGLAVLFQGHIAGLEVCHLHRPD